MRDIATYTETYCDSSFESVQSHYRRRFVAEFLQRKKSKRILEIGCGLKSIAAEYDNFDELIIVEPSQVFCDSASIDLQSRRQLDRCTFYSGLFEEVVDQVLPRRFDMILISGLLHEVNHPDEILKHVRKCCNEHTIVHVNVPNADSLHRLLAVEMGLIESPEAISTLQEKLQQQRTFNLKTLKILCEDCGFKTDESGSYFPKYFTHEQMHELMRTGILTPQILDGIFQMSKHIPSYGSEIFVNLRATT
ncbi:MAG: class I SAM-dependent methyltransferase [Rhodopirellula sp.]|nr:class I SAM-dependent methyltransferase [Rhodopirellula sp.]